MDIDHNIHSREVLRYSRVHAPQLALSSQQGLPIWRVICSQSWGWLLWHGTSWMWEWRRLCSRWTITWHSTENINNLVRANSYTMYSLKPYFSIFSYGSMLKHIYNILKHTMWALTMSTLFHIFHCVFNWFNFLHVQTFYSENC